MKWFNEKLRPILGSLRLRIFLLVFVCGFIPIIATILIFLNLYEYRQVNNVITSMSGQTQLINTRIIQGGYLNYSKRIGTFFDIGEIEGIYSNRILVCDRSLRIIKDTYDIYDGSTLVWEDAIKSLNGESTSNYDRENHLITVTVPISINQGKEDEEILGVMAIMGGTYNIEQDVSFFKYIGIMVALVCAALLFFAAIILSVYVTRPFVEMNKQIKDMDRTKDVTFKSKFTEVKNIQNSLYSFTNRLKKFDTSRQEFVSNVSHELKTPLTSMKILADSLTSSEDAPVEFYREFMTDIASEIDRETKIINDLISIVRMEKDAGKLDIEAVNLNECIERIMKQLRPMAEARDISLVLETFRPITVDLDEVKMSQALINLIENAIKYNEDGGWVHVSINSDHQYCFIRVEDNGIGIAQKDIDEIFERFYRADKSHSKEIEGTGLGLSITKNIIQLHRGEIKVQSIENEGTTFDIRLPLTFVSEENI